MGLLSVLSVPYLLLLLACEGADSMTREHLRNRRPHLVTDFEHGGIRFTLGVGFFDNGRLAEVFLNSSKVGTGVDTQARDGAILLSLLLQHGCPLETIRRALLRNPDGSPAGPLSAAVDLLSEVS